MGAMEEANEDRVGEESGHDAAIVGIRVLADR